MRNLSRQAPYESRRQKINQPAYPAAPYIANKYNSERRSASREEKNLLSEGTEEGGNREFVVRVLPRKHRRASPHHHNRRVCFKRNKEAQEEMTVGENKLNKIKCLNVRYYNSLISVHDCIFFYLHYIIIQVFFIFMYIFFEIILLLLLYNFQDQVLILLKLKFQYKNYLELLYHFKIL